MRYLITFLIVVFTAFAGKSQMTIFSQDTTELPSHSFRAIAKVKSADYEYMVIVIENVVSYSRGISATPSEGDEITVRLPGRNKPEAETRIEVDLKESIDLGAMPTSYIMLDYRTIE
jgi:hypothetical protein